MKVGGVVGQRWLSISVSPTVMLRHNPKGRGRLILMGVCNRPVRIRNGFYEFLEFGSAYKPRGQSCSSVLPGILRVLTPTQGYEGIASSPSPTRHHPARSEFTQQIRLTWGDECSFKVSIKMGLLSWQQSNYRASVLGNMSRSRFRC